METFSLNLHRIDKDVARCDRGMEYYSDQKNLDILRNIVTTYVWEHLDIGYMQGMCDLVAPLLLVIDDEVIVYSCFTQLMERMIKYVFLQFFLWITIEWILDKVWMSHKLDFN